MGLNIIITGSTGMIGKGVLLECLESDDIESILIINRRSLDFTHPKIKEIVHKDFLDLSSIEKKLKGYQACFFCLGVSAVGMSEAEYSRITFGITLKFAETVLKMNPEITFNYISGQGTDSSENGKMMWARVKGKTENALLALPFERAYMFRPGLIQPMKGIRSSSKMYNLMYVIFKPFYPLLKAVSPNYVTSTVQVGKAMVRSVTEGPEKNILNIRDINHLARSNN
jgi:uncharacterized protein YbjT (DUF2867 family)